MKHSIKNNILEIEINSLGAELWSIKKDNTQYLWQGDENSWKSRATNIFPFIGRMEDGKYKYNNKIYEMNPHGFCRHTDFALDKKEDTKITFKISSNEDTLKIYPFLFEYYITYELKKNTLVITSKVINKDNKTMYFAIGGHPGFITPINDSLNFEDYYLQFDSPCKINNIRTSEKGLVTHKEDFQLEEDKILKLKHSLFDNDALIFENVSKGVTLKTDKNNKSIYVKYEDMKYLGIWQSVKKSPNFICIEPWTSLPPRDGIIEDIETQDGLISLDSNKEYANSWSITIK